MKQPSGDIKKGIFNSCLGAAVMVAFLLLGPSDSYGQFQMGNTLIPLLGNSYPIIYANDAKGGHHQVANIAARNAITTFRRQVGMLCTVLDNSAASDGSGVPQTYQLICADTKAARDNNANWVVFNAGGSGSSVAWSAITANPFNITTPVQGQLLSYDGGSSSWLNVNQSAIPLSGFSVPTTDVLMGGFKISNLADPASAQDAATRNYVDAAVLSSSTAIAALNTDTATIQPRLDNIISSLSAAKLNVSDTAAMLANYQAAMNANNTNITALLTDTATIQPRLNNIISSLSATKLNISDTAAMLANYQAAMNANNTNITALLTDTATIQPRLNNIVSSLSATKLNISDTAAMLANYQASISDHTAKITALLTDSATIQPRLDNIISNAAGKMNLSDTAAMLQYYAKAKALSDSIQILRSLLNTKLAKVTAGYGLSNTNDSSLAVDSATLAQYFVRRADSVLSYVTHKNLADSAAAIRSGLSGLKNGVDTIYNSSDTIFWSKSNQTYYSVIDTFSTNITAILSTGNTFGKYKNNSVIPSQGKSARQVITDALTESIAPAYTNPSVTISSVPAGGTYEYGYALLGTITLNSVFTQGDAGAASTPVYYANGVALGGNSFSIPTLTSTQTAYVNIPYAQGNCKNNNLGVLDCTGRITASSKNSSTISFIPGYRRYFGWLSDTTGITTGAQNAAILALVDNTGGWSTSQAFGTSSSPIDTKNPTGTQFWVMGYVSSTPMSSITQNGFPSIAAYNTTLLNGFINNQGAAVALTIYYSKVGQTSSSTLYTN